MHRVRFSSGWYLQPPSPTAGQVRDGELLPADLLLLRAGLPGGVAFVRTTNLDGETNLKIRHAVELPPQQQEGGEEEEEAGDGGSSSGSSTGGRTGDGRSASESESEGENESEDGFRSGEGDAGAGEPNAAPLQERVSVEGCGGVWGSVKGAQC